VLLSAMTGKIQFKEPTLNGRAQIIAYSDREFLYLRIPRGEKKYSMISLRTTDLKTAHDKALDVYAATVNTPQKTLSKKYLFKTACDNFLKHKQEQVDIGQLRQSTQHTYEQRINQRVIPYAKMIGIEKLSDIKKDSFSNYSTYYRKVGVKGKWKSETKGLAISTINSDLTTVNELLSWCVQQDLLEFKNWGDMGKLRDRKDYREDANPAYMPDEWEQVKNLLKDYENSENDPIKKWKNCYLKNWVYFQYHGGFRCHETRRIRLNDIEVVRKNGKVKWGVVQVSPHTKTGKRTVIMNGNWLNAVKYHLNKGIKLRNEEIEVHNKKVEDGTIERWRSIKTKIDPLPFPPPPDTPLMANPFIKGMEPLSDERIRQQLKSLLEQLDFYKTKDYTLHSLRSTHITHALIVRNMNIREIADNVGNSQSEIERTYYRLNNLLNMEKLGFFKDQINARDSLVVISD